MPTETAPRQDSGARLVKPRANMQGCFICRIRKKRCSVSTDITNAQGGQSCQNCSDLSIRCLEGYRELIPAIYRAHLEEVKDILKRWNRGSDAKRPGELLDLAEELKRRGLGPPAGEEIASEDATFGLAPVPYNGLSPTSHLDVPGLLRPSHYHAHPNIGSGPAGLGFIDFDRNALAARGPPSQGGGLIEHFRQLDYNEVGMIARPEPFINARTHSTSAPISFQRTHDTFPYNHTGLDALHHPHAQLDYAGPHVGFNDRAWYSLPDITLGPVADSGVRLLPPSHLMHFYHGSIGPHRPESRGLASTPLSLHNVSASTGGSISPAELHVEPSSEVPGAGYGGGHGTEWWPEQDPGALGWDPAFAWDRTVI